MAKLKRQYEKKDDVPESLRDNYVEQDGVWVLDLEEDGDSVSREDLDRVNIALNKERKDHKATRESLRKWEKLGAMDDVSERLERLDELDHDGGEGEEDKEAEIERRATKRSAKDVAKAQRDATEAAKQRDEAIERATKLEAKQQEREVEDLLRPKLEKLGVESHYWEDAFDRARAHLERDDSGAYTTREGMRLNNDPVPPHLDVDRWLEFIVERRPGWIPPAEGSGAPGSSHGKSSPYSGANNPWSHSGWSVDRQAQAQRELGDAKARELATAAGSSIGSATPPKPAT